jgi:hypothetical protein
MTRHAPVRLALLLAVAVSVAAGCNGTVASALPSSAGSAGASGGPVGSATAASPLDARLAAAKQYCTAKGGMLVDRVATWNTNADPSQWVPFGGRMTLCEFESGEGDQATRISVDLLTLFSEQPTLAAVAYLSKVPPTMPETPSANPAAYNCQYGLGGSGTFGNGAAGGGWVDQSQPVFVVMDLCMFEDGSAIDEWGITYYAEGTVRGADLAPIFRYQPKPGELPAVYPR